MNFIFANLCTYWRAKQAYLVVFNWETFRYNYILVGAITAVMFYVILNTRKTREILNCSCLLAKCVAFVPVSMDACTHSITFVIYPGIKMLIK